MMGSPNDEIDREEIELLHKVVLTKGFYMQTTLVTQEFWEAVMNFNPSAFQKKGKNYPVENVSWNDTQEFIKQLNEMIGKKIYRLPTEAEWEYACRAKTNTRYYRISLYELAFCLTF